jgi:hypothetical protein
MQSQGDFYEKMLKNLAFTVNDVRKVLNMNSVPWGDTPFAPSGMTNVSEDGTIQAPQAPEMPEQSQSATDTTNEDEPQPGA